MYKYLSCHEVIIRQSYHHVHFVVKFIIRKPGQGGPHSTRRPPQKARKKKRVVKKGERVYVMLYSGGRLRMSQAQLQQKKQVRRRKYFGTAAERVKVATLPLSGPESTPGTLSYYIALKLLSFIVLTLTWTKA